MALSKRARFKKNVLDIIRLQIKPDFIVEETISVYGSHIWFDTMTCDLCRGEYTHNYFSITLKESLFSPDQSGYGCFLRTDECTPDIKESDIYVFKEDKHEIALQAFEDHTNKDVYDAYLNWLILQ